jgi:2,5-diamino-6-(ribosylamino)-4(3H)-pyrimidinone 5'-phosphate reductase
MTVDGKIDTVERRGATISSERDKQRVDALRASVDAVMVGGRTLLQEDPRLTVRSPELRAERVARGQAENPAKVGVLSRLRLGVEAESQTFNRRAATDALSLKPDGRFVTAGPARVMLFCPRAGITAEHLDALRRRHVEVFPLGDGRVDLVAVMDTLATMDIKRVLVEGGGTLNFELLRVGVVDEVNLYLAPAIFGGASAPTLADGIGGLDLRLTRAEAEVWEDGGVLLRYIVEPR